MAATPQFLGETFAAADTGTSYAAYSHHMGLPAGLQRVTAVQTITLTGATTGTFTLYFRGETTAPIAWNASTSAVDAALEALAEIPASGITVTGSAGNWVVTFTNMPGAQSPIFIDDTGTDGTGGVAQTTQGVADMLVWVVTLGGASVASAPGWTQRALVQRSPDPSNVYVFTRFWLPGDDSEPDLTLTSGGTGRHYSMMLAFRGVDPNGPINATQLNNNFTTSTNTHVLPNISTLDDDSLVVYATGTSRNAAHTYTWAQAQERADHYYAPASAYTPGGWFQSSSQVYYSLTAATLVKSAAGAVGTGVWASANGGSASTYWFGVALALSPVPDSPPPPQPPPEHPDCVSANFANGSQLAWGRPVQGIYFDQAAVGTSVIPFTTSAFPGTLMYDHNITWTNSSGLPLLVTPVFVHGAKQVLVLDPIQAWVDEYWAMTSGAAPSAPSLPSGAGNESNKFGGGSDSSEPCVFQYLEEDLQAYAPFGQFTVPNGHQVRISYQCRLSTSGSSASSATASQWAQVGSHRIMILGEVVPDPAL